MFLTAAYYQAQQIALEVANCDLKMLMTDNPKGQKMPKLRDQYDDVADSLAMYIEHLDGERRADQLADTLRKAVRAERASCQRIALEYGGGDAEQIAEMIGQRNFSKQ